MSSASPRFRMGRRRTQAQTWAFTDKPNRGLAMQKNRTTYPTGRQAVANDGPGSFSFQGLAKPRMAKAWPGAQPMRRIAAAMLVSPPLRSSPKTTLRNAAIT